MVQCCLSQSPLKDTLTWGLGNFRLTFIIPVKQVSLSTPENLSLLSEHHFLCHLCIGPPSWNVKQGRITKSVSKIGQKSPFSGNLQDHTGFSSSIQNWSQTFLVSMSRAGVVGWPRLVAVPIKMGQPWLMTSPTQVGWLYLAGTGRIHHQAALAFPHSGCPAAPTAWAPAPGTTGQTVCGERVLYRFWKVYLNQLKGQISFNQEKSRSSLLPPL